MTLLSRYLVKQNLFLLFTILLVGTGLYVLTDMFERLDSFLESGVPAGRMLFFFLVKIPTIISLILPAVYLMALVAQMNFLERSRELVALHAGGVSPSAILRFVFLYGIVWAFGQLIFAQVIGVEGERVASRIWQEDVRGHMMEEAGITSLWFTDHNHIVHIGLAYPVKGVGEDVMVYTLDESGVGIEQILKARRFSIRDGVWHFEEGQILSPALYASTPFAEHTLDISQDLKAFQMGAQVSMKPTQLSLRELSESIERLERAGSNVENLRTAWHGKLAYAASIIVMGFLALIVTRLTPNIYKATVLSILIVFFYYGTNTMCFSMGEKGLLSPLVGGWFANALFFTLSLLWLLWPVFMRRVRG